VLFGALHTTVPTIFIATAPVGALIAPEGARIVTGVLEVTTTFAANANFNIGDGSSAARFNSSVINIDATGETEFAKLANEDGNLATELSAETPIVATFDTAGGNGAFEGYILYVDV